MAQLEAAEDAVQSALEQAMLHWPRRGTPANPAGWLHQVARRSLIDTLRHRRVIENAVPLLQQDDSVDTLDDDWQAQARLPDSLLHMMFVCCHPALDRRTQLALTLKILCGFGVREVAAGLLQREEAVKKRLQRGRARLKSLAIELELPADDELPPRLDAIHHALYLMFNEGYSASSGTVPIHDDICEEATRLCHLIACHPIATPATHALLALMLCHAARIGSRTNDRGDTLLLEEQDRSSWDRGLIEQGRLWLQRSGLPSSRYHLEAAIALLHCQAESTQDTDWSTIAHLYQQLSAFSDSPLYRLNRALALAEAGEPARAATLLDTIASDAALGEYHLLASARGRVLEKLGRPDAACDAYREAAGIARADHARTVLERHIKRLSH